MTMSYKAGKQFQLPIPAYRRYLSTALHAAQAGVYDAKLEIAAYRGYVHGDVPAIEKATRELRKAAGLKVGMKKLTKAQAEAAVTAKAKLASAVRRSKRKPRKKGGK